MLATTARGSCFSANGIPCRGERTSEEEIRNTTTTSYLATNKYTAGVDADGDGIENNCGWVVRAGAAAVEGLFSNGSSHRRYYCHPPRSSFLVLN